MLNTLKQQRSAAAEGGFESFGLGARFNLEVFESEVERVILLDEHLGRSA
jgi:hypothetical protein